MLSINSLQELTAAIVTADQSGAIGLAHLLRAHIAGRIAIFAPLPDTSMGKFKQWAAMTRNQPAVALVGDDDYSDQGPAGWPLAARIIRWAVSAVVHAAGAEIVHYETAVVAARVVKRVLIIECSTTTLPKWRALVEAARPMPATLIISPPDNGPHPILPAREAMQ
jgi:hypothetical protein